MKTILLYIFVLTLFLNSSAQNISSWEMLNEGKSIKLVEFVNGQVGWIYGHDGKFLKTEDGAETWNSIPLDENIHFYVIDFINESTGWGIAWYQNEIEDSSKEVIIKSTNGGQSWRIQKEVEYPQEIQALNDTTVYMYTFNQILKTSDGGQSWKDITPDSMDFSYTSFRKMCFLNSKVGVLVGYLQEENNYQAVILKTVNGGESWETIFLSEFIRIEDFQFVNGSKAYFLARSSDPTETHFCVTTDSCKSWIIMTSLKWPQRFISFTCPDENSVMALIDYSTSGKIMKSTDSGESWTEKYSFQNRLCVGNIFFSSANSGYVNRWGLLYTTDHGENWEYRIMRYNFRGTIFLNNIKGFAYGGYTIGHGPDNGDIFITNDGGKNWSLNFGSNSQGVVNKCIFINESTGFLLITGGYGFNDSYLWKTEDAGKSWTLLSNFNSDSTEVNSIRDFCFINETIGWAIGEYYRYGENHDFGAAIFGTQEAWNSCQIEWKYPDTPEEHYQLNSIFVVGTTAWAVGEYGMMVKYTEEDNWQLQSSITDLPLNDVYFCDDNHGWIAGGYLNKNFQLILLKTTNGGLTWDEIRFDKYLINDMYFADSLHGWAVGENTTDQGMVLESFDGGENWIPVVENLSAALNAIHFKDSTGWAVGGNGLILRSDDGVTWIDQSTGKIFPAEYQLFQNYPNPFNPKTTIEYTVGAKDFSPLHVNLSVYNILGQKVVTLVNKKQPAGNYKVEWDASGYASGIYYYKLTAGDFQQMKKMVLIK